MKILFLQKRLLFPTDTGGKIRTLNVLRHLARRHDVTYLSNLQPCEEPFQKDMLDLGLRLETIPWRETRRGSIRFWGDLVLNLLSRNPYNVNKDYDPRLRRRAAELLACERFDLIVCDFVQMARNVPSSDAVPKVLFEHNVESQIFRRHADCDRGWLRRAYMRHQSKKMSRFESSAGRNFQTVIAVSELDRQAFQVDYGWKHVEVIDTAVDLDYFQPLEKREHSGRVVFIGSMDWLPNEDAVQHFVTTIWPLIRQERPDATFQIVGRNPSALVRGLANVPGIEVTGSVADVRPFLAEAAIVVVPLRIGGGTRLKIFEALAMKKAVISTTLGAEGLHITPGTHLQIADDSASFATNVIRLLNDATDRMRLGEAGYRLVVQHHAAERIAQQFERICQNTVDGRRAGRREASARGLDPLCAARCVTAGGALDNFRKEPYLCE